jgi:hypothetical protein
MPCSRYKSKKQRGLCYLTHGWKNWEKVKKKYNKQIRKLAK